MFGQYPHYKEWKSNLFNNHANIRLIMNKQQKSFNLKFEFIFTSKVFNEINNKNIKINDKN